MFRCACGWLLLVMLALPALAVPVRILATGDMHGWLKGRPLDGYLQGGPAAMLAYWKQREEFAAGKYLVVSSGDNYTGSLLSNLLEGEPDIEVMNAMCFHASALGNHEFDFGRGQLLRMQGKATFPYLAANLYNPDGTRTEVVKPYAIIETQGVKVAVIGLANRSLQTAPNIGILKIGAYDEALRTCTAEARAKGAQAVIVIANIPMAELVALARLVADLRIPLMLGGFSHEVTQQYVPDAGTWVMCNGERWAAYARIDLEVDAQDARARVVNSKQVWLEQRNPAADPAIAAIVDRWQQRLGPEYNKPLGSTTAGLLCSTTLCAFTLHSWLVADATANFAMINMGGIRQDLPAGAFTKWDVINSLPFEDKVFRVKVTGEQLLALRPPKGETYGVIGLRLVEGKLYWSRVQQPIDEKATYRILVNDYLYNTSEMLRAADPAPATVLPDWRTPIYRWLADHKTSQEKPVEKEMSLDRILKVGETGMVAVP